MENSKQRLKEYKYNNIYRLPNLLIRFDLFSQNAVEKKPR